jgi:glycosyltransferase involved in cell wall biosynthesis
MDSPAAGAPRAQSPVAYHVLKEVERLGWSVLPLDQLLPWIPAAVRAARRIARPRRVDAVLAIGDPFSAFLAGAALKRSMGLPLVLDLRDPWTIDPAWFSKKVAPLRRLEAFVERTLFGDAEAVILNTQEALRAYRKLYPDLAAQMECIPNGFDRSLFLPAPAVVRGGPFTLLHYGNVFGGRSIAPILRALRRLIDAGELAAADVRVVIRGELDPADVAAAAALGLGDRVEARAYRPYREAMIELRAADVLVALEARDLTLQIPAKVYDYLCAERPILSVGQPGEAAELIERLGVGMHFAPEDEAGIAAALSRWVQNRHAPPGARAGAATSGSAGGISIDDYDAPKQTALLAAVLDRAVASAVAR